MKTPVIAFAGMVLLASGLLAQNQPLPGMPMAAAPLMPGDRLNVGPYSFTFDGQVLVPVANANQAEILCNRVSKEVTDRATGNPLRILNDISLVVTPCEFTVIIGPSGGGKSTLLKALLAFVKPDFGDVELFGEDAGNCGNIDADFFKNTAIHHRHFAAAMQGLPAFFDFSMKAIALLVKSSTQNPSPCTMRPLCSNGGLK